MSRLPIFTLQGWPEDRLPTCSAPTCGREIKNGEPYVVLEGTIKLVCRSCALDPYMREATLTEMVTTAVAAEQAAHVRRRALSAQQQRQSTRITRRARRVRVRPEPPSTVIRPRGNQRFRYPPHPCAGCGRIFQPRSTERKDGTRGPQQHCSISCAATTRRSQDQRSVCPACERPFRPTRTRKAGPQICCSRSCGQWWRRHDTPNPSPPDLVWSRSWGPCCRACGSSDRKHRGQGYCPACYRRYSVPGQPRASEPQTPDTRTWATRVARQHARLEESA